MGVNISSLHTTVNTHTCTHLPRMNKTSTCAIDNVYKGKMKKTEFIKMERKTARTRLREKFSFDKDIYLKLYMGDSVTISSSIS